MPTDDIAIGIDGERFVHQTVDGEVLVIDTKAGIYFNIGGAAARLWPLIAAGTTPGALRTAAEGAFAAPADSVRAEVDAVLKRLEDEGIVRPGFPAAAQPPALSNGPLEAARIERYDDMRDLLTLDPIHDTADTGWPNVPR